MYQNMEKGQIQIKVFVMIEKRKHPRINSLNLSYICSDENGAVINEGMGRTLNVSESGILLETNFYIDLKQNISLTIAFENELVDIRGRVVHCRVNRDGKCETGIQFLRADNKDIQVLKKFIKVFQEQSGVC